MTTQFKLNPMPDGSATLTINNGYGQLAEFVLSYDEIVALANTVQTYMLAKIQSQSPRRGGKQP